MSIFGKFFAEFTPGDWEFSFKSFNAIASTTVQHTTSFSSGDGPTDILGFLNTFKSRLNDELSTSYGNGGSTVIGVASDVFPSDFGFAYSYLVGGSTVTESTLSVEHSTLALGFRGVSDWPGPAIANFTFDSVTFSSCTEALLTVLGFDETETVTSDTYILATNRPRYVWFPGVGSYGTASGVGVTSDTGWLPVDAQSRIVSGAGNVRVTGPSRMQYTRRLRFEAMKRAEAVEARHTGPIALMDSWATMALRWYPDRDVGVVGAVGTQGDPGPPSYHVDADCDYWAVRVTRQPRIQQAKDPDWFTITIELNGEPA